MRALKLCASFAVVIGALVLGGCANKDKMDGDMSETRPMETSMNMTCPMMDDHDADPEVTVTYKGKKVAFCCEKCIGGWEKLSDEERDARLASAYGGN